MDTAASLKQTVTHLFDSVRYSNHAKELDGTATSAEDNLETELSELDGNAGEIAGLLESMRAGTEEAVKEFTRQVEGFLETAKQQATEKLQRNAAEVATGLREASATERDKALKSLETYLASEPLPIVENTVQVRISDATYEASSTYHCEGDIGYEFRLATQNSGLFNKEFSLSQLGYDLKIPVRLSRAILKKASVPGFERLDQYVLAVAETSSGRVRATFQKEGNGAKIKIITSGSDSDSFVGIEYSDQTQQVNVMTDPALSAHVNLGVVKQAMSELVTGIAELSLKKIALLGLSLGDEESLRNLDSQKVLQQVLKVMGPAYQATVKKIANGTMEGDDDLNLDFIRDRLKVLGSSSASVAGALGLKGPG